MRKPIFPPKKASLPQKERRRGLALFIILPHPDPSAAHGEVPGSGSRKTLRRVSITLQDLGQKRERHQPNMGRAVWSPLGQGTARAGLDKERVPQVVAKGEVTCQQACEREAPAGAWEGDPGNTAPCEGAHRDLLNYFSPQPHEQVSLSPFY